MADDARRQAIEPKSGRFRMVAIVFGTGHVAIAEMARAGFHLNLVSIARVSLLASLLAPLVFG
ncbi:MAG: hypothetical protein VW338_08460 [Rhodospirillaceae bacterium]